MSKNDFKERASWNLDRLLGLIMENEDILNDPYKSPETKLEMVSINMPLLKKSVLDMRKDLESL